MDADEYERLRQWAEVAGHSSYYELLGILELADEEAIQRAFHEHALAFHPDLHAGSSDEVQECVEFIFRLGVEAYRTLTDPELRRRYDLALAEGEVRWTDRRPERHESPPDAPRSLESLCRSPAAKLWARRADARINVGDFATARQHLLEALSLDEHNNEALEERLDALDDLASFAGDA